MKRNILLIILAVGLLIGGTAASFAENLRNGICKYADLKILVQIHTPAFINGDILSVKLMNKAAPSKHESVLKYRTIIQSFSGVFVQYPQRCLPVTAI